MRIEVFQEVYEPCDDTYLLARNLEVRESDEVLEIGTGSGILAIIAARKAKRVVACDINKKAIECAKHNAKLNNVNIEVIESDLFSNIKGKFDLIIFNPPYLPSSPLDREDELAKAWDGGETGREVINKFIKEAKKFLKPKGRVQIVASSRCGIKEVIQKFHEEGFETEIIARERHFFEELVVIKAWLKE